MFIKKQRRNFRQRKESSSDGEDAQKGAGEGGDAEKPNKLPQVAQSRGISCSSKPERTPERPGSSDGEDAETLEVTAEKQDRDTAKKITTAALSFSQDVQESTFKLKKSSDKAVLFQVKKKEISSAKTSRGKASASGYPRQDSDSKPSPQSLSSEDDVDEDEEKSDGADSESPLPSSASDSSSSSAIPVAIPNAKAIKAAKKLRRANRAQKDYISLGRDGRSSAGSTPDHYSREDDEEDRVEDEDDEPDDHQRRIEFAPRLKSIRERIAEKLAGSEGSLSGSEGEEQDLWEETQIGKGVKRHPGNQSPSGSESSCSSRSRRKRERQKKRLARARIPKTAPSVSISMIKKGIAEKLDSLKGVHRARLAELTRMLGDVENARASEEILRECSSESQMKFYRGTALYVHNLLECLQEKVVEINSLELELHTLLSDQTEALLARRRREVKEQADRVQQFSYGTAEQSGGSANGAETQSVASQPGKSEDDDFPEDSQPSAEEQEQLQRKCADVMLRSQAVFSDVQDDFSDIRRILSRFEEWRRSYPDTYHNAYISLCLPKLLNPTIRHQLLGWNPLKDASGDFENLPWFTAVETFCYGHGHEELEDIDRETLSNVIEKTVLPKLTAFAELVWDPMSRQQSVCLSDVCHRLKEDYSIFEGEQRKPIKTFIESVVRRMRSCVDEDVFIPLYPKKFLEDTSSPQSRFRQQQISQAIKLLGNMGKWDLLLPETSLKELMLDKLLNRYLMISLCSQIDSNGADLTCKKIAETFPPSWFRGVNSCLPQLKNFENYLVQKVHTICKQKSPKDQTIRAAVVELLQILSRIRCNDSIMAIAEKYHYEDIIYSHQLLNQEKE